MIFNGNHLLDAAPIKGMLKKKVKEHGVSHGLSEAGYDIRIAQNVQFSRGWKSTVVGKVPRSVSVKIDGSEPTFYEGRFCIASAIEEFDMPTNLVGIVHDKSTWARQGLSVFNTVIEPGWKGFLTLELVYHGNGDLFIPAGSGIAQVVFHQTAGRMQYEGKYQNQENRPVVARKS